MKRLLSVVVATIGALALAEAALRATGVASHLYTEPAFEMAPRGTYWRYRPEFSGTLLGPTTIRSDSDGARLHDHVRPPSSRAEVIAIFGDSITMGQGVEAQEAFPAVLEGLLGESGIEAIVRNFGVQGHSLEMIVDHAEDMVPVVKPALAILALIEDDLSQQRTENRVDRFGYLTKRVFGGDSWWQEVLRAGMRRSHLVLMLKAEFLKTRGRKAGADRDHSNAIDPQHLERFRRAVSRFEAATRGMARLILLLDGFPTALTKEFERTLRHEFPSIPFVRVSEQTEGLAPADLRLSVDGHPNARAHQLFAKALGGPVAGLLMADGQ